MADGLSVTASVIAVVQLAGSCLDLSKKWLGPSEFSPADLAAVKTTLLGFTEAMTKFQIHLTAHGGDGQESLEYLPQVLERCIKALGIVQSFMENSGFIGKHVIGPRFDNKLKASLKALEAAKELFAFALHADNQAILLKTQQYIQNFAEDSRRFQESTTNSLKGLHENSEEVVKGLMSLEDTGLKRLHENSEYIYREVKRVREDFSKFTSVQVASALPNQGPSIRISSLLSEGVPFSSQQKRGQLLNSLRFDQIDARKMTIEKAHTTTCRWCWKLRHSASGWTPIS